jgi:hypothetical protein
LTGFILSAVAFLGTQVDNMAATFLSAASISFVLYCLSHSIRGSNRLFGRLAIIGGILWLTTGAPLISIVTDPEEGSRVLIRVFPFSWIAQISEDNRKALLGLSVLIVPFIAGIIGNYIVRLGAISPRLTARLLLPLYVVFIVLLITCPHWLRSQL